MEERVALDDSRADNVGLEILEGVDRGELRHPRVAELRDVGSRFADKGREQLLMRGGPGHGLDAHVNAGILALELGDHLLHDFAFGAHGPEAQRDGAIAWRTAAERQGCHPQGCHPEERSDEG